MTTTLSKTEAVALDAIGADLSIRVVRGESSRTVVAFHGEADASTTAVVSDALSRVIASYSGAVVIDLAELEFIDSATVRILARTQEFLLRRGRRLAVRSPSRLALVVLDAFGLTDLVEAAESPADASFDAPPHAA